MRVPPKPSGRSEPDDVRPLADPLRFYRRLMVYVALPVFGLSLVVSMVDPGGADRTADDRAYAVTFGAMFALLWCTSTVLPDRRTDAIYLRSFRNDAATGDLRGAAQRALGDGFRLSGIRDPRRRWHWLFRHTAYLLFMIRYAQPKYMNLEAGDDWKQRLWRSLGEARCALVDVSELTTFVREEVELAVDCLGLERVLFVGDRSRSPDEWREAVSDVIGAGLGDEGRVRVAVWADTPEGRTEFEARVRAFAAGLPAAAPGPNYAAFPAERSAADTGGNALRGESWWAFALANAVGIAIVAACALADDLVRPTRHVWLLPALVLDTLAAVLLVRYYFESPSPARRRALRRGLLLSGTFAFLSVTVSDALGIGRVHRAVARMHSGNNLKHIGLAVHSYTASNGDRLPPQAVCRADGTPLLSWRVLLLPHLDGAEGDALFKEFKLDEPWDGPHNVRLLGRMPPVYRSHYRSQKAGPSDTYYQLVIGPDTIWGPQRPSSRGPRRLELGDRRGAAYSFDPPFAFGSFPRPAAETIMAAEAADAVPWTKPEDVSFVPPNARRSPDEALHRLGATKHGSPVVMLDGSVRTVFPSQGPDVLDALVLVGPR